MQPTKYGGVSLEVWSAIHGVHVSLLKRMSQRGLDVTSREAVRAWIKANGRETTRFRMPEQPTAPEKPTIPPPTIPQPPAPRVTWGPDGKK